MKKETGNAEIDLGSVFGKFKSELLERLDINLKRAKIDRLRSELSAILSEAKPDADRLHLELSFYSNQAVFEGVARYLRDKNKEAINVLVDGWVADKYQNLYREHVLHESAKNCRSFSEYLAKHTASSPNDFLPAIWALCGLYYIGDTHGWDDGVSLLETTVNRGDFDRDFEFNPSFSAQLELLRFLAHRGDRGDSLSALAKHEPFGFVRTTWENDEEFSFGLGKLCEWHINQCKESLRHKSQLYFYYLGPYPIFPVWIFALDKCREREVGRSCLPDNEFINFGSDFLKSQIGEQRDPLILRVQKDYESGYGKQKVDFKAFWEKFINTK